MNPHSSSEPVRSLAVPPATTTVSRSKPSTSSENSTWTSYGWFAESGAVSSVTVGAEPSYVAPRSADAVFGLPAGSVNAPALSWTEKGPSAVGVTRTV